MRTYKRICIKDHVVEDSDGNRQELRCAQEYITSGVYKDNTVVVFSTYWVKFPVTLFAGEVLFTE